MRRVRRLVLERWDGLSLVVLPDVLNPVVFRSGILLAEALGKLPPPAGREAGAGRALDMGTGSGIGALALARVGFGVVAVDVNPEAVRCARINTLLNTLEAAVDVREGSLFAPVGDERFDVIAFNPPFFVGTPSDLHDRAWRAEGVFERFAAELPRHLAPGGVALVLLSDHGAEEKQCEALRAAGLEVAVHARRDFLNERLTVWSARPPGAR
ncbi:MAG: methyltransferase [Holophagales bacterium]|nr:methyltransferase [Holophagales bacterium]